MYLHLTLIAETASIYTCLDVFALVAAAIFLQPLAYIELSIELMETKRSILSYLLPCILFADSFLMLC
jgi:hypothetical protein